MEISVGKTVIRRLDTLEDLISSVSGQKKKTDSNVVRQLKVLRQDLIDLLQTNSIEAFAFEEGTELDVDTRKIIKIVDTNGTPGKEKSRRPQVEKTLRIGFRHISGNQTTSTIIRKPEVVVGYH